MGERSLIMMIEDDAAGIMAQATIAKGSDSMLEIIGAVDRIDDYARHQIRIIEDAKERARWLWGHEITNGAK